MHEKTLEFSISLLYRNINLSPIIAPSELRREKLEAPRGAGEGAFARATGVAV
jgi:hypothetical protein